jgi:F-type H+-transporting ATPase subunit a
MLGKNLPLSYFVHDPQICDSPFLGISALGKTGDIHVDTIGLTIVSMVLILGTVAAITPRLTAENSGGPGQTLLEMYYDFMVNLTEGQIGSAYKKFLPLISAIFIFILINNFLGVGPWKALEAFSWWPKEGHEPFELASATTDFNVTAGLATVSLLYYLGSGFWAHGIKYLKHYLNPIEVLDIVVRPSTLALRLMLVISADEILRSVALTLVPWFFPTGVMAFELFIGIIQAFVFALLTSIYIGLTVSHGDSH